MSKPVYLLLENGEYFEGKSFGAQVNDLIGEVVFTTGMTGYIETLTDPSYFGQIVIQTFPLIGNYGVIPEDFENYKVNLSAYIVKEWCQDPSNFRNQGDLDTFFKGQNVPGVYGLDTRKLAKTIRVKGSMNGLLTEKQPPYSEELIEEIKKYHVTDAVKTVTPKEVKVLEPTNESGEEKYHVVLWDFGAKANIGRELQKRGCKLTVVPAGTTCEEILSYQPDGIMLSNGPGDPEDNPDVIEEMKKLKEHMIPTFGICLGHQLFAIANGACTKKMKFGHRGANQPVKDIVNGRVYISSQNHGYEVMKESIPDYAFQSFVNVNDGTCEGITYKNIPAFTVQFHPEACGGPKDTEALFDRFIKMMDIAKEEKEGGSCR